MEPVKCVIGFTVAAERWDVSDKAIRNWIKKGLPVSGTQRKRVFDVSECDAWVASYRDEMLISREEYELFAAECVIEARDQMLTRRRFTLRAFTKIDRVTVITRPLFLILEGKSQ
ncbi:hypothetical protein V144x_17280 [Gimesia aquarii]|uniref:Helix-turn-helix domain protein n=2 Tax=Gimesia aquarii TaxID=2527964 RepID=A0A517VTD5_9PLAN|nr:hypothetical protein V144x_17280 [Gimesia aquarii]